MAIRDRLSIEWVSWFSRYRTGILLFYLGLLSPVVIFIVSWRTGIASGVIYDTVGDFRPESLLFMIQLVGFVFVIVVFLIQNTTQAFSTNLSNEVIKDKYIISILILFLCLTGFSISGVYYNFEGVLVFFNFSFLLSSLIFLLSLTFIVSHYLDVSNILITRKNRTVRSIDRESLFRFPEIENEDKLEKLKSESTFYSNTALEAIDNREYDTAGTCIICLEDLGVVYLQHVNTPVDKEFIQELNDQFHFLIHELGDEYSHQKNLNNLVDTIGVLSRATYINTQNDDQTSLWLASLREIFELTKDELDRTEAYGKSISEINRVNVLHLSNTNPNNLAKHITLANPLEQIAQTALDSDGNEIAIQKCLAAYEWQFITIVNLSVTERFIHNDQDVERVIGTMHGILREGHDSNNTWDDLLLAAYFRLNSLYSNIRYYGVYGAHPNLAARIGGITSSPPEEADIEPPSVDGFSNPRYDESMLTLFMILADFQIETTKTFNDLNRSDCYSGFAQLLFVLTHDVSDITDNEDGVRNVELYLTKGYCESLEDKVDQNNGQKPISLTEEHLSDYFILLYHHYRRDDEHLMKHLMFFVKLYEKLRSTYGKEDARWLYMYLKWFGALIHNSPRLTKTRTIVNYYLKKDFYEIDQLPGRINTHPLDGMGYPITHHDTPRLSPKQVWNAEQSEINQSLQRYEIEKCERFHKYLKREHKWN